MRRGESLSIRTGAARGWVLERPAGEPILTVARARPRAPWNSVPSPPQHPVSSLLQAFIEVLASLAPFLLLGFTVAGLLHAFVPPRIMARALGGTGLRGIVAGAAIGIPLPLCSCGVVPVAVELRKRGASRGATASFLVATPETGVDSIATSVAVLHPLMVVFRPVAALITAIASGVAVERLSTPPQTAADSADGCCEHGEEDITGDARGIRGGLRYAFDDLFAEVAVYLLPAILITAALTVWLDVPTAVTAAIGSPFVQMLVLLGLGIPVYVCATAATPIAAALIVAGFSPGAALVFLLAGPATNLMTISAVVNMLGRRAAVVYCATIAITSLAFGALLDAIYAAWGIAPAARAGHQHEHIGILHWTSAAIVGGLVAWHLAVRLRRARR